MKTMSLFGKMKLHYYVLTFTVVVVLFLMEDARPFHKLCSQYLYGRTGHTIIFIMSFVVSFYFGFKNVYLKWAYPICVAMFMYFLLPMIFITFIYEANASYFLIYYLTVGIIFVYLPHIAVPFLGVAIGRFFST